MIFHKGERDLYITETHMHTSTVSPCATIPPEESVPAYVKAGYQTLVITDHFNEGNRKFHGCTDAKEWINFFVSGYRAACHVAEGTNLSILLGMEICFDGCNSEFLVYGLTEEDFFREPEMYQWGIQRFYPYAHEKGWVVVQAHPFRNGMTITPPGWIDGIETYNGNPRHDSRNDISELWAKKFRLLQTAGSDYHQQEDLARGGILTGSPITSNAELIQAILGHAQLYHI